MHSHIFFFSGKRKDLDDNGIHRSPVRLCRKEVPELQFVRGCSNRPETQSAFEACATDALACMEKQAKGETFRPTTDKVPLNTPTVDKQEAVRDITQFCNGATGAAKQWCSKTLKALATTPEQGRAAMVARVREDLVGVQFAALADDDDRA